MLHEHPVEAAIARRSASRHAARLGVLHAGGRTRIGRLYQEGAAKIRMPRSASATRWRPVLINTAGGLTGGDRIAWESRSAPAPPATVTTQACEKIYRAASGTRRGRAAVRRRGRPPRLAAAGDHRLRPLRFPPARSRSISPRAPKR